MYKCTSVRKLLGCGVYFSKCTCTCMGVLPDAGMYQVCFGCAVISKQVTCRSLPLSPQETIPQAYNIEYEGAETPGRYVCM